MPRHPVSYFCKKLGVADTVAHAWLSIPRKHAEKCLPQLVGVFVQIHFNLLLKT